MADFTPEEIQELFFSEVPTLSKWVDINAYLRQEKKKAGGNVNKLLSFYILVIEYTLENYLEPDYPNIYPTMDHFLSGGVLLYIKSIHEDIPYWTCLISWNSRRDLEKRKILLNKLLLSLKAFRDHTEYQPFDGITKIKIRKELWEECNQAYAHGFYSNVYYQYFDKKPPTK